jgi:hypothetical protein
MMESGRQLITLRTSMNNIYQFVTITFNHQDLIIDHLESIKKQIILYGSGRFVMLTIIDDCSVDKNVEVIECWLSLNVSFFETIEFEKNTLNLGIKNNYLKAMSYVKSLRYKLLAGDDIYYEKQSIFDFMDFAFDKNLVFSRYLLNGKEPSKIHFKRLIYLKDHAFWNRFFIKRVNLFPAPASYVNTTYFRDDRDYLLYMLNAPEDYEDLPTWRFIFLIRRESFHLYPMAIVDYRPSSSRFDNKSNLLETKSIIIRFFNRITKPHLLCLSIIDLYITLKWKFKEGIVTPMRNLLGMANLEK